AAPQREIVVGDTVKLRSFGSVGIVDQIKDGVAEVRVKSLRLKEKLENMELVAAQTSQKSQAGKLEKLRRTAASEVQLAAAEQKAQSELNVIGQTTDEAVDAVDKFLDEASLASLSQVRIVHGHGTGALRRAIAGLLDGHPHVARFRPSRSGRCWCNRRRVETIGQPQKSTRAQMRYPQTFIDDLKRQADIVRVVQDYVQLKKKGANWMACCPFHKEKTPSFSVSPAKEIFYCFGCHKGGSVFDFVMEIERVPFPEAIKIVADKVGMPLPKMVDDSRFEARRQESDLVIQLNSWAMEWWQQQLESSNEGRIAREYLKERGITEETQKAFRLGYAPDSWDALSTFLR